MMRRLVGIAVVVFPLLRLSSQDDLVEMESSVLRPFCVHYPTDL